MKFYLGTHVPNWLGRIDVPLFVSTKRLQDIKRKFPKAIGRWALDSGGFTELSMHGRWTIEPQRYIEQVRFYQETIGNMDWAAPQDWMCEPWIVAKTGLDVLEHQRRTVSNFIHLKELGPELHIIPVLQGWQMDDYLTHLSMYEAAGLDLTKFDTVGLGSVCRRQATSDIEMIVRTLYDRGLKLHGFGVKTRGLKRYGQFLKSSDSMAWSFTARRGQIKLPECEHGAKNCANCSAFALTWRERVLEAAKA